MFTKSIYRKFPTMRLERLSLDEWEDALPNDGIEVFHSSDALSVLDAHTDGQLELLGGFKGDRPTALLPAFVREVSVGRMVTSPPPGMGVPRLGPILMPASPKRRKRERVNKKFSELVVGELDLASPTTLFQFVCPPMYTDPRPYTWQGFGTNTQFTYQIDVSNADPDELLTDASKSLRREVSDGRDLDITVNREGISAARRVFEETRDRYAEQGESFPLSWPYVRDLVESLGDHAQVYVVRSPDMAFLAGVIVLYSPETACFWLGGGRAIHDGVAVNSLIHWQIIEDIAAGQPIDTVHQYDLHGANTERLCQYKSKFGPTLHPFYVIDTGGYRMDLAEWVYETVLR